MQYEKVLALAGSALLLVSWAIQQFMFDGWNSSLARIGATEAVFHSYRANDGVFRAIRLVVSDPGLKENISDQQWKNYEKGLQLLKMNIDLTVYDKHRARAIETLPDGIKYDDLSSDGKILVEFDVMHNTLIQERCALTSQKNSAEASFISLYAVGTLLILLGGLVKVRQEMKHRSSTLRK